MSMRQDLYAAMLGMMAMADQGMRQEYKTVEEAEVVRVYCRDCALYKAGKTFCKEAGHSITANTVANNCKNFK